MHPAFILALLLVVFINVPGSAHADFPTAIVPTAIAAANAVPTSYPPTTTVVDSASSSTSSASARPSYVLTSQNEMGYVDWKDTNQITTDLNNDIYNVSVADIPVASTPDVAVVSSLQTSSLAITKHPTASVFTAPLNSHSSAPAPSLLVREEMSSVEMKNAGNITTDPFSSGLDIAASIHRDLDTSHHSSAASENHVRLGPSDLSSSSDALIAKGQMVAAGSSLPLATTIYHSSNIFEHRSVAHLWLLGAYFMLMTLPFLFSAERFLTKELAARVQLVPPIVKFDEDVFLDIVKFMIFVPPKYEPVVVDTTPEEGELGPLEVFHPAVGTVMGAIDCAVDVANCALTVTHLVAVVMIDMNFRMIDMNIRNCVWLARCVIG